MLNPLVPNLPSAPVVLHDMVSISEGTAVVHLSPGCSPKDYLLAMEHEFTIECPIAADGTFDTSIKPEQLAFMTLEEGQTWILEQLKCNGTLLHQNAYKHMVPFCNHCNSVVIHRFTEQWFLNVKKQNLIESCFHHVNKVFGVLRFLHSR